MPETLAAPIERRGRPSIRTPENRERILHLIRERGFSFSRAAETAGIDDSAAGVWRNSDEEFKAETRRAEGEYIEARTKDLLRCRTKWKTPDPKALELALRRFPEFRQHQQTITTQTSLSVLVTLDGSHLAELQARHAACMERLAAPKAALLVEDVTDSGHTPVTLPLEEG